MIAVLARIVARYASGALIAAGWLDGDTAAYLAVDPDVLMLIGAALGAVTEGAYAVAKRAGRTT